VAVIEHGNASPAILSAINAREAEVAAIDAKLATLSEPVEPRMAVGPTWVQQQLQDAAGVIGAVPERAKAEVQRLGIGFALHPMTDEAGQPFLRAVGSGDFERLAFSSSSAFPTTAVL
jgi:hypothetical protein